MKTDDLIAALAADAAPVPNGAPQRALLLTGAAGIAVALALVLGWLGLRPDLGEAVGGMMFWTKAAYTALLSAAFFGAAQSLARPAGSARGTMSVAILVLALFAMIALWQWFAMTDPTEKVAALKGGSWTVCTRNIFVLGAPTTVAALLVVRGFAPTRPVMAGLAGGLFAGAVAATVYGLHCPEATMPFVAVWYSLGVFSCGVLGALLGRWVLRW